jgi:adenylate cyclase
VPYNIRRQNADWYEPVLLRARINACLEKKRWHDKEQAYLAELETERAKSERLLLNILPQTIAERLKQKEEPIIDRFPEVTVLFADLVGFTTLMAEMPPDELIVLLNEFFRPSTSLPRRMVSRK